MTEDLQIGCRQLIIINCSEGNVAKPGSDKPGMDGPNMMACLMLTDNIFELFPYINSVADQAEYYDNPHVIRMMFKDHICVLYPDRCIATPFYNRTEAGIFAEEFLAFIHDIASRKETIQPNHKVFRRTSVVDIIQLLPRTNCGDCGFPTCMAFAAAVSKQRVTPTGCPYVTPPVTEKAAYPVYDSQGNLLDTISLDIDTKKTSEQLRRTQIYLEELKKRVDELSKSRKMAEEMANEKLPSPLSEREIEVLRMVACGATNTEIGRLLFISPHTVKSHVISIFNKLGVNDRTQASVWAAQQGLL